MKTPKLASVLALFLAVAAGCGGRYKTSDVSQQERQQVVSAIEAFVAEAARQASQNRSVPPWLADVSEVKVLKVEKMKGSFKALVELKGKQTRTQYFVLTKQDGEYEVSVL